MKDDRERHLEDLRQLVRTNGFMSAAQIFKRNPEASGALGITEANWSTEIRKLILCDDIRKVQYTNRFIEKYKNRDLFYYKPKKGKK